MPDSPAIHHLSHNVITGAVGQSGNARTLGSTETDTSEINIHIQKLISPEHSPNLDPTVSPELNHAGSESAGTRRCRRSSKGNIARYQPLSPIHYHHRGPGTPTRPFPQATELRHPNSLSHLRAKHSPAIARDSNRNSDCAPFSHARSRRRASCIPQLRFHHHQSVQN